MPTNRFPTGRESTCRRCSGVEGSIMRRFALPVAFATLTLLGTTGLATAVPAPPIELRAVVACSEGLQPLPPPDKECLAMNVLVGDLDIAGAGRQYPRDDT